MNQPEDLNPPEEINGPDESSAQFEEVLRNALRHVDAPHGFADRTMARIREAAPGARSKVVTMRPWSRVWYSGAIAAALLVGAFVGQEVRLRHQREQAELAQQQFEAGMRITDRALEHTREQLERAGVRLGTD